MQLGNDVVSFNKGQERVVGHKDSFSLVIFACVLTCVDEDCRSQECKARADTVNFPLSELHSIKEMAKGKRWVCVEHE